MKFYGQFTPPVDKFIFERYFPDTNIHGVFVECGAFDGTTESSCKFFEETMNWDGFNLEPVPCLFDALTKNRPNSNNINLALSNKSGKATFKHAISPELGDAFGNGSLSHAEAHMDHLMTIGCEFEDIDVSTITWRDFVIQQNLKHVDLMVLDVEGHELSVIKGMKGSEVLPDIMCIEFGHIGINKIRHEMEGMGYVYDITSNANAFFMKKDVIALSDFRRSLSLDSGYDHQNLLSVNKSLQAQLSELRMIYNDIVSSKLWKVIETIRKIKSKLL